MAHIPSTNAIHAVDSLVNIRSMRNESNHPVSVIRSTTINPCDAIGMHRRGCELAEWHVVT